MPAVLLAQARAGRLPLRDGSVHCVVTSPPYWGQRLYQIEPAVFGGDPDCVHEWGDSPGIVTVGNNRNVRGKDETIDNFSIPKWADTQHQHGVAPGQFCIHCGAWRGQLGLEPTPDLYLEHLIAIFREVRRVLHPRGQCFVVIDDKRTNDRQWYGIPERFVIAMQADGWRWEDKCVWHKLSCLPNSHRNRFTHDFEPVYVFNKSRSAYFDPDAVREPHKESSLQRFEYGLHVVRDENALPVQDRLVFTGLGSCERMGSHMNPAGRNHRAVWSLGPESYAGPHYAAFPSAIPDICIRAGSSERGACPTCGAPWARVVERTSDYPTTSGERGHPGRYGDYGNGAKGYGLPSITSRSTTIGWQPTCACYGTEPLPDYPARPKGDPTPEYEAEVARVRAIREAMCAEFATLPADPCVVLDPFCGTGVSCLVARNLGRHSIGVDLSTDYLRLARERTGESALDAWHSGEPTQEPTPRTPPNGKVAVAPAQLAMDWEAGR